MRSDWEFVPKHEIRSNVTELALNEISKVTNERELSDSDTKIAKIMGIRNLMQAIFDSLEADNATAT